MKKRFPFIFLFVLFLFPFVTEAKTYTLDYFSFYEDDNEEIIIKILEKGDVIDFSDINGKVMININNDALDTCFGAIGNCETTYTFKEKMIYTNTYNNPNGGLYICFSTLDDDSRVFPYTDMVDGHVYRTGDFIVFPHRGFRQYYYDENGENIRDVDEGYTARIIPYKGNDVFWKLSIVDGNIYAPVGFMFELYPYVGPEFNISCKDKSISYGSKTKCSVVVSSKQQMKEVSFNLNAPNLKITNEKAGDHATAFKGDGKYNFRFDDGFGVDNMLFTIMTFDLEGTKNASYMDDVQLADINYTDDVFHGNFRLVKSDLKIVPKTFVKNPETFRSIFVILLPIIILVFAFGLYSYYAKNREITD